MVKENAKIADLLAAEPDYPASPADDGTRFSPHVVTVRQRRAAKPPLLAQLKGSSAQRLRCFLSAATRQPHVVKNMTVDRGAAESRVLFCFDKDFSAHVRFQRT